MSRNRGYDSNESRRSPRDRSPASARYNDPREAGQQRGNSYRGSDGPSRPSIDSRANSNAFSSERDNFRDSASRQPSRDFTSSLGPPRAPKAFQDAPTGPRAAVFTGDARGRGTPGRGRGWHDSGRDRARDPEYEYRDRRDERGAPPFRGDRGRDREWMDRDRRERESLSFRARRPSSPGSGYVRGGRARGRGDWDARSHGRPYDDRDRFRGRSRTPPSRRTSVASPPPQAPEVPEFGSVISHQSAPSAATTVTADNGQITPTTTVAIPTGPRLQRDHPLAKTKSLPVQGNRFQRPSNVQWGRQSSATPTQDQPSIPKAPTRSAAIASVVTSRTTDSSQIPPNNLEARAIPAILRTSLPRENTSEDEDSESESGEDMDDYFEAETRKVQDQLAQNSIAGVGNTIGFAAQETVVLHPVLEPPEKLSDDGDELEETKDISLVSSNDASKLLMSVFMDGDAGEETEVEEEEQLAAVRRQMKTPPTSSLPFGPITPWWEDPEILQDMEDAALHQPFLEEEIRCKILRKEERDRELQREYKFHYEHYLKFCDSDDPAAVKFRAKVAADQRAISRAASVTPVAEGRPEGRRAASRFATEHDIARVLQESKREAQEKQERSERAAKAKAASEKEASIPEMIPNEEQGLFRFADTSHMITFERAPAALGILAPVDNFTEEEREIFEKMYLDYPKQWSKIAAALPGRDYKNCIQHYYIIKHDDSLKEKLKKKEKGKKKGKAAGSGGKPKSNALMANLGSRDGEADEGIDIADGIGERRRPRRAAAPIWPFEAPSESETTTPAPTPGRRAVSTTKGDASAEAGPTKRKSKATATREKGPKQAKNGQLLAAAPPATPKPREDDKKSPSIVAEKLQPRAAPEQNRFGQWDGPSLSPKIYPPPRVLPELHIGAAGGGGDNLPNVYDHEFVDAAPTGMSFETQNQDRRNLQQTSSYWSVPEQTDFPALLQHFGTDWPAIAKWMGSKTHIMVKNYYQRQLDSGKSDLEEFGRIADLQKAKGESTGPPPTATIPIKRRYDGPSTSMHRHTGSIVEALEDKLLANQSVVVQHASSPPQPPSSRFLALAQASPVPQTIQPSQNPSVVAAKPTQIQAPQQHQHQQQQQQHQQQHQHQHQHQQQQHQQQQQQQQPWPQQIMQNRQRGVPQLGLFNPPDGGRPILQAATTQQQQPPPVLSDPLRSRRTLQAAQEAEIEQNQALRKQQEQQMRQTIRLKQESQHQDLSQYEQYPTPAPPASVIAPPRSERSSSIFSGDRGRTAPTQEYAPRNVHNAREMGVDRVSAGPPITVPNQPVHTPRNTISAPPIHHEPPPAARPQPPAVVAVRQQETVRKTSSIMSLLNDEPSEPRAPQPKQTIDPPPTPAQPVAPPVPQQPLYQPAHSLSVGSRKTSLEEMHGPTQGYPRSSGPSQAPMRVVESSYPAAAPSQPQPRSQTKPQIDQLAQAHRDHSNNPYPYPMRRDQERLQQGSVSSPQLVPSYHAQQVQAQQPAHRQVAYGSVVKPTVSPPPSQYAPLHPSRDNSFDGRYGHQVTAPTVQPQMHYGPMGGGLSATMSYQSAPPAHHSLSSARYGPHSESPHPPAQSQMGQQYSTQHQQPLQQAYVPLSGPPLPHHTTSTGSAPTYSPSSYDSREPFRPAPPQQHALVDRLMSDQERNLRQQQQMMQQQQQQQQQHQLQRDGDAYQRHLESRYQDPRRG